jgi:DNA-binding transcriptional LysR family regulator
LKINPIYGAIDTTLKGVMPMELRVLKYFLMVAREENITKAAQLLGVTQPTLSRQIMQLEEELGVNLFIRSNHNIILTDDGMLLKRRAEELVSLAEKTKREFSREEGNLTGEIAIGSGELRSVKFLADILTSFRKIHPFIRYELYSGNADQIKDRIEKGLLDVGLLLEPVDIGKYEFLRMPSQEEWGVLTRKDSELALKETVNPHDLKNAPLLITKRELVRSELASWFGSYYDQLDIAATYNLIYNAAIMVQNKIGVALGLKLDSAYDGLCFVPLNPQLKACSVLAWKKNQMFSPATGALLGHARVYLKSISRD